MSVARDARRAGAGGQRTTCAPGITDRATFGYLGDVFVLASHRGCGLSKWQMECEHAHPELQGFRRCVLLTRDAQGLYAAAGWQPLAKPDRYMERWDPEVSRRG